MARKPNDKPVPQSRLLRVGKLSSLATRIAGSVISGSASKLLKGERPALSDLVLTPKNIQRLTDQLANLRGAAMKLGQLISMDGGDLLSPELSAIMARLREDADPMPKAQLQQVLDTQWGEQWQDSLLYFSFAPIAAASIGQVHKAITMDGETLAVKVQYPGIKQSIDSDVDNVATLISITGIVPKSMELAPLLEAAKAQLHDEADYIREARMLRDYATAVANDDTFVCPSVYPDLSTDSVLAMSFINGESLNTLAEASQEVRNRLVTALFTLFFKEVFEFKLIQSDPNLANYRYLPETQQIALLDFGACRELPTQLCHGYQRLLSAMATDNKDAIAAAAIDIGLMTNEHSTEQQDAVVEMGRLACESIRHNGPYNFGTSDILPKAQAAGMHLSFELDFWHAPPPDAILIHRKLGGLFLMAKRFEASVDMGALCAHWYID